METGKRRPVAPFYAVAALWLLGGLWLPLYTAVHYALLAAVSAVVFLAVNALCRSGGTAASPDPRPEVSQNPQAGSAAKSASGTDPALENMTADGRLAISEMRRLNANISHPGISADIDRLEQVSEAIFAEVRRSPQKLPQLRRFLDYYLPTTLKLLNAYDRMSSTGVSGQNIDATLARVEDMMHTIVRAFEKQLDSLYGAEALDISADISALETMMAREGLTGPELQADPAPPGGTDIRLEL